MYQPKTKYAQLALDSIIAEFTKGNTDEIESKTPDNELLVKRACFVSIHNTNGDLRGCIGTLEPIEENLHLEIIRNSIAAATRDSRFIEISKQEVENIEVSVDVLSLAEKYEGKINWDTKKYGLIASDIYGRKAILLPNISGIDTAREQLKIVKRKAGIFQKSNQGLKYFLFTATRYH
ncbi:MAG: AmmeMemoRadiSam system protein A [Bacteroidota bacterium]|nr:AmmeMemoRadiSam system protein A [Bacteroidota bacterium]